MNLRLATLVTASLAGIVLVRGWSERCEVCDSTSSFIASNSHYSRTLNIDGLSSKSGNFEFYLRVDIEHTYLEDLRMFISQDGGSRMKFWDHECGSSKDLSAIFYDSGPNTVDSQDECDNTRDLLIYARPSNNFSENDIGQTPAGNYIFQLYDDSSDDTGYLYEFCVGFFDEEGCDLDGYALSTICELCSEEGSFIQGGSLSLNFKVNNFEIFDKGDSVFFFVRVNLEYDHLSLLSMSMKEEDTGYQVYLMNEKCDNSSDLNVIFSDMFDNTIWEKDECDRDPSTALKARPEELFSYLVGYTQEGEYVFKLEETANGGGGYLNRVCIGWNTSSSGCTINSSTKNKDNDVALIVGLTIPISVCILCICAAFYIRSVRDNNKKNEEQKIDSKIQDTVRPMENNNNSDQPNGGGNLEMASNPAAVSDDIAPASSPYNHAPGAMGMDLDTYPSTSTVQTEVASAAGFKSKSDVYQSTAEGFGNETMEGDGFQNGASEGEAPPAYGGTAENPPIYGNH